MELEFNLGPNGNLGKEAQEFWQKTFPNHEPQEIYQILKRGMPPYDKKEEVTFSVSDDSFKIKMNFYCNGAH